MRLHLNSTTYRRSCDSSLFFFQAEDGIRYSSVTGVQTCALPISPSPPAAQKSSTKKCYPLPLKPKWSSGFATLSIRKPAARASVHRVPSDIRKQRHSIPSPFFRFQDRKSVV